MSTGSLFRKPFSPKKAPVRKATTISPLQMDAAERSREFMLDYTFAHMQLDDHYFSFDPDTGNWFDGLTENKQNIKISKKIHKMQSSLPKDSQKIQKENMQLQEENNLLKVKNEILIDMVAEICSEYGLENKKK